ncbi:MerR family transcriptional regulator [Gordonia sp. HY002]|uniref:DNA polymerase III subunit beta family protein n=1 Tax=Gordonia zhenghanii TaxID=2911516 RepID=UPI001EF05976|nr:MerR family transcriptional regulator [Gordonia zhenghanii]MCF8571069.1 MerR family transcriptional regulator [Gordonia zhenghanii]MCF8606240.1 MerR family transcriptional regulator [Gordonia zhenghanii]
MTDTEMTTIGEFAKSVGMTASALRFYDDVGLIRPARVDPVSGYRFYTDAQRPRATQIRQLRDIGMSLPAIACYFTASASDAARIMDEHVSSVTAEAAAVQRTAATIRASSSGSAHIELCSLPGPVLAAAVDQVLATTVHDPEAPVLSGVHLDVEPDSVSLSATDRYRFATRTLVQDGQST